MTTTLTPIKAAQAARDEQLAQAQRAYKTSVDEINANFAAAVRAELAQPDKKVIHVANDLGTSRQTIHDILRRYPAAA